MAVTNPAKVPQPNITSVDVTKLDGGLSTGGAQSSPANSFIESLNVQLDRFGFLTQRPKLSPFLPDTVETTYQKFPALVDGQIVYFTLDDGKAKWTTEGSTEWEDCGGDNSFVTQNGGFPKFIRVLDCVMILNGKNGDKLAYIDLSTPTYDVVKYSLVTNPASALTSALTNLTTGPYVVYYAYSYSGAVGETELSPILTQSINIVRDQWQQQTNPGSIKVSRPAGLPPAGAKFWNLYVAVAATSGSIQPSDMLQLAVKLDLSTFDFVDDGSLSINLGSVAPIANSTDGPKVSHGIVEDGNPILYGDEDNPYNIWIGGGGPNAMDFSYRAEPQKGTNFYPTVVVGFRNGQGIPSLTVLYSSTEGISKQAVLQQQTVNYGDQSFTVWGVTEQHYGAAGVAAPNSAINYNGKLLFVSTDGVVSAQTQPSIQNVLSILPVSSPIDEYVRSIRNSAMPTVVGTGWGSKYMWLVPNAGFETPQQIMVLDANNKGLNGDGAWYTYDIAGDWIGTVSPEDNAAFVYISQGNKTYKLLEASSTFDTKNGVSVPFAISAKGPLLGVRGNARNVWMAGVQVKFNLVGLIGPIYLGVTYRNLNGTLKTKTKFYQGPVFTPSVAGGYGDTGWSFGGNDQIALSSHPAIDESNAAITPEDVRKGVRIDDIFNEWQWFFYTPVGYSALKQLRGVSPEGIDLGVRPDLQ